MDDLVGDALGEVGRALAGEVAQVGCADADQALGEDLAVEARDLDRVVGGEAPATSRTPAARSETPRSRSAARAPSSTTTVPEDPTANAIQSLRADSRFGLGWITVPAPGLPATTSSSTPSREAWAITARTPDHDGDLGGGQLRGHAAAPPDGAGRAGHGLELVVDLDDLLDQRRRGVEARVGGEEARRVGEQHEEVGVDQVRDQRREAVVVAEADLVVGDGVVLVDDRARRRARAGAPAWPGRGGTAGARRSRRERSAPARPRGRGRRRPARRPASAGSGPRPRRPGG